MKKIFNIVNVVLILTTLALATCYTIFGGLWLKALASTGFVLVAVTNLIYAIKIKTDKLNFAIFMVVGFVFAMAGDIVLNIEFMIGAILFAIGHIFYFVAYCFLNRFNWTDLIPGMVISVVSVLVVTLVPLFNYGGLLMEMICVLYAIIISMMIGKAVANLIRERNFFNIILLIGSFLFFFSDLMLLFNVFGTGMTFATHKIFDYLCLATYYPGQCVLAHSIMYIKKD